MLSDRNYMRSNNHMAETGPNALILLIIINVVTWVWTGLINPKSIIVTEGVLYAEAIKNFQIWRLITYQFLHANFFHLFFNMWGLYIFGSSVAEELGRKKFLLLYFISGIFGGLLWLAANWTNTYAVVLGASGSVFGVMLAMAMLNPNREYMIIFFPVPIKCRTLIIVYAIIEILSQLRGGGNVAHLAHLGGFIAAYFYIKFACSRLILWDPLGFIWSNKKGFRGSSGPSRTPKGWTVHDSNGYNPKKPDGGSAKSFDSASYKTQPISPKEIDRLLDKISSHGINSLTPDELQMLKQARNQMKRG